MQYNKREDKILKLFFQEPSKQFKFKELIDKTGLHRDNVNNWLIKLQKENMIKRIKPRGKFPYYVANYVNPTFKNRKKLYALTQFYESGLLDTLNSLEKAKAVIIFGSFSRSDWHKRSDIDIFIYGKADIDLNRYEEKLNRGIHLFSYKSRQELKRLNPYLMKNIMSGYYVKGNLSFLEVS